MWFCGSKQNKETHKAYSAPLTFYCLSSFLRPPRFHQGKWKVSALTHPLWAPQRPQPEWYVWFSWSPLRTQAASGLKHMVACFHPQSRHLEQLPPKYLPYLTRSAGAFFFPDAELAPETKHACVSGFVCEGCVSLMAWASVRSNLSPFELGAAEGRRPRGSSAPSLLSLLQLQPSAV